MSNKYIQPPRGTHDLIGDDMRRFRHIVDTARRVTELYNFQEMQTPIFEFSEVFHRSLGDTSDVVSKETYTFPDRGGESLTLRPEFTAAIVRAFISNGYTQKLPFKAFYAGPAFRYERPQKGRQRQFHQVGVECLGAEVWHDAEVIACANTFLRYKLKLQDVSLEINTLGDVDSRYRYREKLVAYFESYKHDLSEESRIRLEKNPLRILDSKQEEDKNIVADAPLFEDSLTEESEKRFEMVKEYLEKLGILFVVSPRLVRGLDYYSDTVFEFTTTKLGSQATVLAGGRYNGLVKQMGGGDIAGVGWAAGIERLMLLHAQQYSDFENDKPYLVVVNCSDDATCMLGGLVAAAALRSNGYSAEMIPHNNMGKALKKAENMEATHFIHVGEKEYKQMMLGNPCLKIKDLNTRKESEKDYKPHELVNYFEDLKKQHQQNKLLT